MNPQIAQIPQISEAPNLRSLRNLWTSILTFRVNWQANRNH